MNLSMKNILFCLLFVLGLIYTSNLLAQETWVPVSDVSLMIEAGSVLDFSKLTSSEAPIKHRIIVNKQGHYAFENKPDTPQRFLIGSLGFGVNLGSFPSHALIDLYVKQYKTAGYNMVRLDFLESMLMEERKTDFDYNAEQLDRFYYLVSALKLNGIYLILNGLSNDNGGYGDIDERWVGKKELGHRIYFEADAQQHWKKLITTMYGSINPYTGVSVLKDPTLAGLILANENNMVFAYRNGVPDSVKPYFSKWLKTKYGSNKALKAVWGSEFKSSEDIEASRIQFPKSTDWTSRRMADTQQFFLDTEKHTADWMTKFLREQGYQGLVTSYNVWHAPAAHASRGQFVWVDMHNYFAHPEYINHQQMRVRQDSMLKDSASYVRELASAKHLGKAYTVTEHGQIFWNQYRRENGLALPAYAALQGWSGICQHSGAVDLSYAPTVGRKTFINPFAVGTDPISRATETLAALLFLRGDVSPAKHLIGLKLTPEDAFNRSAHLGSTSSDVSKLSLVTGIGLDWQGSSASKKSAKLLADAQVDFSQPYIKTNNNMPNKQAEQSQSFGLILDDFAKKYAGDLAYKIRKLKIISDDGWEVKVKNLREAKFIGVNNLTDASKGIYHSDTGEILLDSQESKMLVITPNTEAIVFDEPKPIKLNQLSILSADHSALVAVSSIDNQPLINSKRMLLVLSTDARNSDMQFSDSANSTALSLGKPPVLIRAVKVKLALQSPHKSLLKVYSTNLRGQRKNAINLKQTNTSIEFELDISKLSHGATTYFEISV